jgi:hypothetical protein
MVLLPVVAWRVRFQSVKGTFAWLRGKAPEVIAPPQVGEPALIQARRTTWLLYQSLRFSLIKGKCLSQSLVLWHLLRRQGIKSELRIGFNKNDHHRSAAGDNFNAHAWVECQGVVLNDSPGVHERFVVFDEKLQTPD